MTSIGGMRDVIGRLLTGNATVRAGVSVGDCATRRFPDASAKATFKAVDTDRGEASIEWAECVEPREVQPGRQAGGHVLLGSQ